MRFFGDLGRRVEVKELAPPSLEVGPAAAAMRTGSSTFHLTGGPTGRRDVSFTEAVQAGYEAIVAVYRCVNVNANKAASLPIVARTGDPILGDTVAGTDSDDPLLQVLNWQANNYDSAKALRTRAYAQSLLSPTGVFVEIIRNNRGEITKLHLFDPSSVTPKPDAEDFVSVFEVSAAGEKIEVPRRYPNGDLRVAWFRYPHPTDPYKSHTPMMAAGLQLDIDILVRRSMRSYARQGGPGRIVGIKGEMEYQALQEFQNRMSMPSRQGEFRVLDGIEDLVFIDLAADPEAAQYLGTLGWSKADVLGAFGTPQSLAYGDASNRTFDNADAERDIWWENELAPRLAHWDLFWDNLSTWSEDNGTAVLHDLSQVPVLRRAANDRRDAALRRWRARGMTYNQLRAEFGEDPIDRPEANVAWLVGSRIIPDDDATAEELFALGYGGGTASQIPAAEGGPAETNDEARAQPDTDTENDEDVASPGDDADIDDDGGEDEEKSAAGGVDDPGPFGVVTAEGV